MSESSTTHPSTLQPLSQPPLLRPTKRQRFITVQREARPHSPWKRSACDRCRSHKSKCHREKNDTSQSCVRCIRAREVCFTSAAKSPAHLAPAQTRSKFTPPTGTTIETAGNNRWFRRDSQIAVTAMRSKHDGVMAQDSAFLLSWPFAAHGELYGAVPDLDRDIGMPSLVVESRLASFRDLPVDSIGPFSSHPHHPSTSSTTDVTTPLWLNNGVSSGGDRTPSYEVQTNTSTFTFDHKVDIGISLASIQRDLSRQLFILENTPLDLATLSDTSPGTVTTDGENKHG
ncbi:hypothetical protein F5Y08DRAFT_354210 [Xylaria arbuscula]|nr:hypothetical protein F5Y08DRAFT_354210 [Xylaria arbuscula]